MEKRDFPRPDARRKAKTNCQETNASGWVGVGNGKQGGTNDRVIVGGGKIHKENRRGARKGGKHEKRGQCKGGQNFERGIL